MQEKAMIKHPPAKKQSSVEERQLHVEKWKKSGLTMSAYCRANNIGIARLSEWKRASFKEKTQFSPIQAVSIFEGEKLNDLIEVVVDQRVKVRLQNVREASLIIEIIKGLILCN